MRPANVLLSIASLTNPTTTLFPNSVRHAVGEPRLTPPPTAPHPGHVGIVVAICSALHEHLVTVATFNSRPPARQGQRQSQQASPINNLFGRQRGVKNLGVVTYCQRTGGRTRTGGAPPPLNKCSIHSGHEYCVSRRRRRRRRR